MGRWAETQHSVAVSQILGPSGRCIRMIITIIIVVIIIVIIMNIMIMKKSCKYYICPFIMVIISIIIRISCKDLALNLAVS